jgi:hypothetical protein
MAVASSPTPSTQPTPNEPEGLYEVVDGQIVEKPQMAAFEAWIASELGQLLGQFAKANRLGIVVVEMLFLIDRARNLQRRPDVAFVSTESL